MIRFSQSMINRMFMSKWTDPFSKTSFRTIPLISLKRCTQSMSFLTRRSEEWKQLSFPIKSSIQQIKTRTSVSRRSFMKSIVLRTTPFIKNLTTSPKSFLWSQRATFMKFSPRSWKLNFENKVLLSSTAKRNLLWIQTLRWNWRAKLHKFNTPRN